jgi:hypothetical protein
VLEHVQAIRYVTPLREGGSLPGIVEADDDGTYVVKFRGAGQGLKVLVAEVIVGQIGRAIGLRVPEMRAVTLDARIAKYEADEEVQDLLAASRTESRRGLPAWILRLRRLAASVTRGSGESPVA